MDIVNFNEDPERFARDVLELEKCCYTHIAEELDRDPSLGVFTTPEGERLVATAEAFRRVGDIRFVYFKGATMEGFMEDAQDGKTFMFLGDDGRVIGSGNIKTRGKRRVYALMSTLYLHPDFRGRGIGRMMAENSERYAVEVAGADVLEGESLVYQPTIRFHTSMGYDYVGHKKYAIDDCGDIVFPTIAVRKIVDATRL